MELAILITCGLTINILILVSSIKDKLKDIIRILEIIKNKTEA